MSFLLRKKTEHLIGWRCLVDFVVLQIDLDHPKVTLPGDTCKVHEKMERSWPLFMGDPENQL